MLNSDFAIKNDTLVTYMGDDTEVKIPNNVRLIGKGAFKGCRTITSVTIPEGVVEIGSNAFCECKSLVSVNIPESVTKIGYSAFNSCHSLKSVDIPDSVTEVGTSAFAYCYALKSVSLGSKTSNIYKAAFSTCPQCLEYDLSSCSAIPTLGTGVFDGINKNAQIIVPETLYIDWCNAENWSSWVPYTVSIGHVGVKEAVPLNYIWLYGGFAYVSGVNINLNAYYQINDDPAVRFTFSKPAFGCLGFNVTFDEDTCYQMVKTTGADIVFDYSGTYEFWIENESGQKIYRRILKVS